MFSQTSTSSVIVHSLLCLAELSELRQIVQFSHFSPIVNGRHRICHAGIRLHFIRWDFFGQTPFHNLKSQPHNQTCYDFAHESSMEM